MQQPCYLLLDLRSPNNKGDAFASNKGDATLPAGDDSHNTRSKRLRQISEQCLTFSHVLALSNSICVDDRYHHHTVFKGNDITIQTTIVITFGEFNTHIFYI